jgi:hypothetical protein
MERVRHERKIKKVAQLSFAFTRSQGDGRKKGTLRGFFTLRL